MLHCRACFSRCIRALDTAPLQTHRLRRDGLSALVATQERSASSSTSDAPYVAARARDRPDLPSRRRAYGDPPHSKDAWERSPAASHLKRREYQALRRPVDREAMKKELGSGEMWLGKRDPRMTPAEWDRRRRELQHLHDPLEVAAFVKQELAKGKTKEMQQLVRMASHSMQVVVSWNHIIDHLMRSASVSEAFKVYNEMKKRGQFPDSYTYTIVLRGLSNNPDQSGVASKAIAVYHSLSAPNSRVKSSIIHTNAVLSVCARALDMDALWGFAAKIPESGPGAADARTFTIILNAIRQSLLVDAPLGEGENELAHRRERGVAEGRRMWEDVVGKWRNADLVIEEELVCAMGRLLLVGSRPRDWDDVLSLVEQTMDIPRLVPRLGTIAREALPRIRAPNTPPEFKPENEDDGSKRGNEFLALTEDGKKSRPLTYATPSNATLSMVLEACQKVVAPKAADEYWDVLTDPGTYAIVPDNNNLHQRLRLLRTNRASSAVVQMLQEESFAKQLVVKPGTFRLAMSTCVRDKNNHNSLKNATQILQLMMEALPDADAKTVYKYAELAVDFPLAKGEDLVEALTYLQPVANSIRVQLNVGTEKTYGGRSSAGTKVLSPEARNDAIAALRKIYAVFDRLILSNLIPEEQKAPFKAERARMSALIQRLVFKASVKSGPRASEGAQSETVDPAEEGNVAPAQRREKPKFSRPSGNWRTSRAAPPGERKPWVSPSTD
ncbi:pentatricopeptide repeat protein-like protein [Karstenula rhodostoma CBS 690.94]|uniref:Pentatricopeptide repeat protein-like protein n=1 Tax=Karstenula rhodostoma CBS 690.94 TaxID=1392251 RepID=A0A9P4PKC9_9PLEO|nr:pentatricopeptide repeat protein-like protein [Karstenula rhodostoma CBS 690.94]